MKLALPNIKEEFSDWYNEVIYKAGLADQSPVRGSIVICPYGYAIWENIRNILDKKIKSHGVQNAAFPLLIPQSFLEKEAQHVEGFSPELAVVTHAGGKKLDEPLVIRPTSETIIHYMFAKWIKSWRDLPLKVNQWANIIRWEMRTRPFLRTTEIFWQEGHTAHETAQEAHEMALAMLQEYVDLYQNYLAIPIVPGVKSESERFAGADNTYTVEGLMPDGKALQLCTSHLISQNFAKSFNMVFQNRQEQQAYPYLTSWGFTTRSVGALVMVHGDQKGLVIPPKIAPIQVVIIPIFAASFDKSIIKERALHIAHELQERGIRVQVDDDEHETPGAKFYKWELRGIPLRIEIGQRDIQANKVVISSRIEEGKQSIFFDQLASYVETSLQTIQEKLLVKATQRLKEQWYTSFEKLEDFNSSLEHKGGFYQVGWCGQAACEAALKHYKATIRCLLKDATKKRCFHCENASVSDSIVARAY